MTALIRCTRRKNGPTALARQIWQRRDVLARRNQDMALEHRPGVQERDDFRVGEHDVRRHGPAAMSQNTQSLIAITFLLAVRARTITCRHGS